MVVVVVEEDDVRSRSEYGFKCMLAVAAVIIITLSSSRSGSRLTVVVAAALLLGEIGEAVCESSGSSSEKGNLPVASSTSVMPRDQMSDLTEYSAPWIRSGLM